MIRPGKNYAYVLKNGVDWYNIFFFIFTQSWILLFVSFSYRIVNVLFNSTIRFSVPCASSSTINFAFPNEFTVRSYEYARVNIEFFTGRKKIKQRRISFVLGYLRMILWKISTAISIKHRILATFNIRKKSILTAYMPLKYYFIIRWHR
jgi:hypothetical protein